MDYEKLIELRKIVSTRISEQTKRKDFELSIRYLASIHEALFKGILPTNGSLRRYNLDKDEQILNGDGVSYPDYNTVHSYLKFAIYDEKQVNYDNLSAYEVAAKIAYFTATIWKIHPFIEGNTRTTSVFIENYLRSLGYEVDNHLFKNHAEYYRNCLVRASYSNDEVGIEKDYMPLIKFFISVLNNEEVYEEDLTVKELFESKKIKRYRMKKLI